MTHKPHEKGAVDFEGLEKFPVRHPSKRFYRTASRRENDGIEHRRNRRQRGGQIREAAAVQFDDFMTGGQGGAFHRPADTAARSGDEDSHELMMSAMKTTSSLPFSLLSPCPHPSAVQVTSPARITRFSPLSS